MATLLQPGTPVLGTTDVPLRRGSTHPRPIWLFDLDLSGSVLVLRVHWDGGEITVSTVPAESDPGVGLLELLERRAIDHTAALPPYRPYRDTLRWSPTPAITRTLPYGRIARFEIERQVRQPGGETRVYRQGYFTVRGLSDE